MTSSIVASETDASTIKCRACTWLSGKGGTAKSFMCFHIAGEASAQGIKTLLADVDPERNLTSKFHIDHPGLQDAPGLADVLIEAGILDGDSDFNIEAGARKLKEVIVKDVWPHVDYLPAGKKLQAISQQSLSGNEWFWLLREIFEEAGLYDYYQLMLLDSAGRRGSLVTMLMYACDVAGSPITDMEDAIDKAADAKARVLKIQKAHDIKWMGVVITGIDTRTVYNQVMRTGAYEEFGGKLDDSGNLVESGEVIAEIPYRKGSAHEAYHMGKRLADRQGAHIKELRALFAGILFNHILEVPRHQGVEAS